MLPSGKESASEFFERLGRFTGLSQADQVLRVAWFIQNVGGMSRFQPKDITEFFVSLSLTPPHVHVNMKRLNERKPKALMWDKLGYYLEGNCYRRLSDILAVEGSVVKRITSEALRGLLETLSDATQRSFLEETINCYRVGAFRAAVIMAWNLAYDHLSRWMLSDSDRLNAFNISLSKRFPKRELSLAKLDDFTNIKEFDVVETLQHAKLISKNVADILREKLKKRNSAAHPSSVIITQAQADDVITDLIHNVISKLVLT